MRCRMYSWYNCLSDGRGRRGRCCSSWRALSIARVRPLWQVSGYKLIEYKGIVNKEPLPDRSIHRQQGTLQIPGLGNGEDFGMVWGLGQELAQGHPATAVLGGSGQHFLKSRASDVIGTRGGEESPARIQNAKSPQVDLVVSPERLGDRTLGLGEGGWVEDDEVEAPPLSLPASQEIERVSLEKLDVGHAIEPGVLPPALEGVGTRVEGDNSSSPAGEVEGEATVVGEAIERLPAGRAGTGG